MVLPFTVLTSYVFLSARPSVSIFFACAIVTLGFFVGVFLDGVNVSMKGVFFGVVSSATTALHAVVIKKAIKLLGDSALDLCWYTNLLSSVILSGVVVLAGEVPGVVELFSGSSETLTTFMWGSLITVGFLFLYFQFRHLCAYLRREHLASSWELQVYFPSKSHLQLRTWFHPP